MSKRTSMENTKTKNTEEVVTKSFDLTNPAFINRFQSKDYMDFYSNRVEFQIGSEDVRFVFVHLLGVKDDKAQMREQCSVTISFDHARRVRDMLNKLIKDDDPRFKRITVVGEEPK